MRLYLMQATAILALDSTGTARTASTPRLMLGGTLEVPPYSTLSSLVHLPPECPTPWPTHSLGSMPNSHIKKKLQAMTMSDCPPCRTSS